MVIAIFGYLNYLAHAYLSHHDALFLTGNFLGDHIKGSRLGHLPPRMEQGVRYHRTIDSTVDEHPALTPYKDILRPTFGLYSGVILDVWMDHLLALHWDAFNDENLQDFHNMLFETLRSTSNHHPSTASRMLHYMEQDQWLISYQHEEGIVGALRGISRRANTPKDLSQGMVLLRDVEKPLPMLEQVLSDVQALRPKLIHEL